MLILSEGMKDHPKLTDEQLVQKSLKEVDFFALLVQRYEGPLRNYILRISSFSYMEVEEILQDVFLKVWENLREFDQSIKFSSWVYRITRNETISNYRKAKSRGIDKRSDLEEEVFQNLPSQLDISQEIDHKLDAELIREVLNSLSEDYKEVLVLRFFEDMSYEEMSDILKKPSGTIATLLNRAKKSFLEALERSRIIKN